MLESVLVIFPVEVDIEIIPCWYILIQNAGTNSYLSLLIQMIIRQTAVSELIKATLVPMSSVSLEIVSLVRHKQ